MITNDELDWATDLPLTEAWNIVRSYNSLIKQIEDYPTVALIQQRVVIESRHPGITWLIQYKRLHPVRGEICLSKTEDPDYEGFDRRSRYIENYLKSLPKKILKIS